ncbi:MAG: PKD domain-containing protein [Thermoplasmatota archaeon]
MRTPFSRRGRQRATMMHRLASLSVGLALLALATSGCFTPRGDGVFGPAGSLGGDEGSAPALSLKASPARGPGPLVVGFSLNARGGEGGSLSWSLDFGDHSAPAAGTELPATPSHTYKAAGAYVTTFKVKGGAGESVSTLSIVVLEGLASSTGQPSPTQGPEPPPEYSGPQPRPSPTSSQSTTSQNATGTPSASSTSTPPTSETNSTTPGPTSSNSTPTPEPTSSTTTTSDTATSSDTATTTSTSDTGSSTATGTSDPSASPSDSQTPSPAPEPSPTPGPTSQSQSSSDPPL